jgi:hypothetical protein
MKWFRESWSGLICKPETGGLSQLTSNCDIECRNFLVRLSQAKNTQMKYRRFAKSNWDAGIRTPISRSRVQKIHVRKSTEEY